jgi:hypothetical protein
VWTLGSARRDDAPDDLGRVRGRPVTGARRPTSLTRTPHSQHTAQRGCFLLENSFSRIGDVQCDELTFRNLNKSRNSPVESGFEGQGCGQRKEGVRRARVGQARCGADQWPSPLSTGRPGDLPRCSLEDVLQHGASREACVGQDRSGASTRRSLDDLSVLVSAPRLRRSGRRTSGEHVAGL